MCDVWINQLDLGMCLLWVIPHIETETQFGINGATILDIKPKSNRFENNFQHDPQFKTYCSFFPIFSSLTSLASYSGP